MPRFVILEHDHPERHWDFMLEAGAALRTWRLAAPPQPKGPISAEASFDHRLLYLDYEGSVSGGRGVVRRWDNGSFEWLIQQPTIVAVALCGKRLRGRAQLQHVSGTRWSLSFVGEQGVGS